MKEWVRGKTIFLPLILLLTALLLFFLSPKKFFNPFIEKLRKPILSLESNLFSVFQKTSRLQNYFSTLKAKDQQIFELQARLNQLAFEQNQLSLCLEENEKLKKLLGLPLPASWKFMEAKVLGISEKMRIDKGQKEGIKEGMMVISENVLVGKVIKVNENDSLVQLLSDSKTKIPVVIKKASSDKTKPVGGVQARGLLLGQGIEKMLLDRVLQSEDIKKGDLVVTSGEEDWLPDLLIGQIADITPKSAEVYQKARVSPLVNVSELRIVFIVIK